MPEQPLIALAAIGVITILCQWFAWWVKLPAILFLLLAGMLVGPVTGWLSPDALFGDLLFPFVSLAVAIILFEGGLTLHLDKIRGLERVVRNMVTLGPLVTWFIVAWASQRLLGLQWELALLFGALMVVTGPTVIVPMLRTVRPNANVSNVLRWEGIIIDPLGALLAILVFEFISSGQGGAGVAHGPLMIFGKTLAVGVIAGAGAGQLFGVILRRHWLPEYLHNVAAVAAVFAVFALCNATAEESGLLAVTVMGMWLANMREVPVKDILNFKESLSVLLVSGLFVILAARIEFPALKALGWAAAGVFVVLQFVARPLKVLVSTWGSALTWRERALLSWIAPRGIVAAAVSALFALRLQQQGLDQANLLVPLTFLMIIGTVVLQSATAGPLARALGVAEPEPRGFLLIGANRVARAIGSALQQTGFQVVLASSNWEHIRAARMQGLSTYYGSPVSAHADQHLDLVGIGRMLGLSRMRELNTLAGRRYRTEFGRQAILALQTGKDRDKSEKLKPAEDDRSRVLFGNQVTYAQLAGLLASGAEIRATQLTETFGFEEYQQAYGERAIPLFALTAKGRLHIFAADRSLEPSAGDTILSMIAPEEGSETND